MIPVTELKRGMVVEIDSEPHAVLDVSIQTPSARGASLIVKVRVRNLKSTSVFDKTFRGGDKLAESNFEKRAVQYLYRDAAGYHFMDQESFDQFQLSDEEMGDTPDYLIDGLEGIQAMVYNEKVIGIELPAHVVLQVVECDPAIKGATAQARTKPAKLETGKTIQVPEYLGNGERVRVDTRDGRYIERARD